MKKIIAAVAIAAIALSVSWASARDVQSEIRDYQRRGACERADLNFDGKVDREDKLLLIRAEAWWFDQDGNRRIDLRDIRALETQQERCAGEEEPMGINPTTLAEDVYLLGATTPIVTGALDFTREGVYLAAFDVDATGDDGLPVVAGGGMAWEQVEREEVVGATTRSLTLFAAEGPGISGALTITPTGNTSSLVYQVIRTQAEAVVQSDTAHDTSDAPAVSLNAFASNDNGVIAFFGVNDAGASTVATEGADFTELETTQDSLGNATSMLFSEWRAVADTAPDASLNVSFNPWRGVAVELRPLTEYRSTSRSFDARQQVYRPRAAAYEGSRELVTRSR